jgi:hypothetical protein
MGKRGPKSKHGKRELNGRLDRSPSEVTKRVLDGFDAEQRDALSVGLEARQRVYGVPEKDTRDQMAGSFVGRLCQQRIITRIQYEAATTWLEDATNYTRVRRSPIQPNAIDLNATSRGGVDNYENVSRSVQIKERYHKAGKAVVDAQNAIGANGNLFGALDVCVRQDAECWHLVGDLRIVLNALAKCYVLERAAQAA